MINFIKRHWKAIVILVLAVVAILLVTNAIGSISNFFSGGSGKIVGTPGIVTFDGNKTGVFDTADEAMANPIANVNAETKNFSVSSNEDVQITAMYGNSRPNIVSSTGKNNFQVDLAGIADQGTVVLKVEIGGDGSGIGHALGVNVETHYFAIKVNNPNSVAQADAALGIPTGEIYFGQDQDKYMTYKSEEEARSAASLVIPSSMVQNFIITAVPSENTARIKVCVCMVDTDVVDTRNLMLHPDNNWSDALDLSDYQGHQVTLMIKSENSTAVVNGYNYVSFTVPAVQTSEPTGQP